LHQRLRVVSGVEESPVAVGESCQGDVEEFARRSQPARFTGRLMQHQQAVREIAVVLRHGDGVTDYAFPGGPP
jgi:hypothetical protein